MDLKFHAKLAELDVKHCMHYACLFAKAEKTHETKVNIVSGSKTEKFREIKI